MRRYGKYVVRSHKDGVTPTLMMNQFTYTEQEKKAWKDPEKELQLRREYQLQQVAQNPDAQDFIFVAREMREWTEKIGKKNVQMYAELAVFGKKGYVDEWEGEKHDQGKHQGPCRISVTVQRRGTSRER